MPHHNVGAPPDERWGGHRDLCRGPPLGSGRGARGVAGLLQPGKAIACVRPFHRDRCSAPGRVVEALGAVLLARVLQCGGVVLALLRRTPLARRRIEQEVDSVQDIALRRAGAAVQCFPPPLSVQRLPSRALGRRRRCPWRSRRPPQPHSIVVYHPSRAAPAGREARLLLVESVVLHQQRLVGREEGVLRLCFPRPVVDVVHRRVLQLH
mmetsp:Transcript_20287/g.77660  ORF Transcript_20287/g.77660 Transcript_20287/m.77660 type:complete len:209 (-) Transcript_20287:1575-2201(-)